jgi:hypothetical protein
MDELIENAPAQKVQSAVSSPQSKGDDIPERFSVVHAACACGEMGAVTAGAPAAPARKRHAQDALYPPALPEG